MKVKKDVVIVSLIVLLWVILSSIGWSTVLGGELGIGMLIWPFIKWLFIVATIGYLLFVLRGELIDIIAEGTKKGIEQSKINREN